MKEKINKAKRWFFEKLNKLINFYADDQEKKRMGEHINNQYQK